jgi:murein DD-endopeptidase MepM/ murein hydrolase activator NlpD
MAGPAAPTDRPPATATKPGPAAELPIPTASSTSAAPLRPSAVPTTTPRPTARLTATPTAPTAATATVTPRAHLDDPIDRTCPEIFPGKPDFYDYYLSATPWPAPNPALGSHFWLSSPLGIPGRVPITDWLPYGYDAGGRYLLHNGVDVAQPLGTPLYAVADGTVVVAGEDLDRLYGWRCDWYGHLVVLELEERWQDQPVYAVYGHVLEITVEAGQRVFRGDQVAEIGFGGAAVLPHLHFEVRVGTNEFGATRNPMLWLAPPTSRGLIAGRLVDPGGRPWQGVAVLAVGLSEGAGRPVTWTYLNDPRPLVNADEAMGENFVFWDLVPGTYDVVVALQGEEYHATAEVAGGQVTAVEIITLPYKTPTPEPPAAESETPSPEAVTPTPMP